MDFATVLEQSSVGEGNRWLSFGKALTAMRHETGVSLEDAVKRSGLSDRRFFNIELHQQDFDAPPADDEIRAYCRALDLEPAPILAHAARLRGGAS